MDVSTQATYLVDRLGIEKGLSLLKTTGYKYLDYSLFCLNRDGNFIDNSYLNILKKTKSFAEETGLEFHQTHAPFPTYIDSDDNYNNMMFDSLRKSIESCSILGAKQIIIHPFESQDNETQKNIELYDKLSRFAKEYKVKIAIENLLVVCPNAKTLKEYLINLDKDLFTVCLDIGHCGLIGENCTDMIYELGHENLKALHIHDNDNISDLHTIPFSGNIDFYKIIKALKDIGYDGKFNLEADSFLIGFPDELLSSAADLMYKSVKYLASLYEKY